MSNSSKNHSFADNLKRTLINIQLGFENLTYYFILVQKFKKIKSDDLYSDYFQTNLYYIMNLFSACEDFGLSVVSKIMKNEKISRDVKESMLYVIKVSQYMNKNKFSKELDEYKFGQSYERKFESKIRSIKENPPFSEAEKKNEVAKVLPYFKSKIEINEYAYVIPMSWLRKWKAYINFQQYVKEDEEDDIKNYDMNEDPGPIYDETLINFDSFSENCFTDISEEFDYLNVNLKEGVRENVDFIVVGKELFDVLFYKYRGICIKRNPFFPNEDDRSKIQVELWLKKVRVIIFPIDMRTLETEQFIYVSKNSNFSELKERFLKILHNYYRYENASYYNMNVKIWRVEMNEENEEIFKKFTNEPSKDVLKLNADLLEDQILKIESLDLTEKDAFVIEYKMSNAWLISSTTVATPKKEIKTINNSYDINEIIRHYEINLKNKFTQDSKYGLVGLHNSGNTCFLNSGIQCLSHNLQLTQYFLDNKYVQEINVKNPLGLKGILACKYGELIKELWQGRRSAITPSDLKRVIAKYASQFIGYSQQDSQELVSYLLDGIHEDLNRIIEKPILKEIESNNRYDEIVAAESWEAHLKRNSSIIVDTFHGLYKSKIVCPTCKKVSITFDPYHLISLPIPCKESVKLTIYFYRFGSGFVNELKMNLNVTSSIFELKKNVANALNEDENTMETCSIHKHTFKDMLDNRRTVKYLTEIQGLTFIYGLNKKMEENDILCKATMNQESRSFFFESENFISFPRLFCIDKKASFADLHLLTYSCLKQNLLNVFQEMKNVNVSESNENNNFEYEKYFVNSKEPIYKILFLNNAEEKKPCPLCGKKDCKKCILPFSISEIISSLINEKTSSLSFEIKFLKQTKIEKLKLNQVKEIQSSEKEELSTSDITIYDCLYQFTQEEKLEKGNEWYCSNCRTHRLATKKMDIFKSADFLILHLKRFKSAKMQGYSSFFGFNSETKKIKEFVKFPLKNLDLSNYVLDDRGPLIYDLYAVSNHYGSLSNGHYTAFAKSKNEWFEFDDSNVNRIGDSKIVTEAAYILFYEKRK